MKNKNIFMCVAWLLLLCTWGEQGIAQQSITPENALQSYLNNGDQSLKWELKETFRMDDITFHNILVTSQKWQNAPWMHQLTIIVPQENRHEDALLFISGGSNKNELPNWNTKKDDKLYAPLADIARKNKAIVALLKQTPNQPLYGDLTEDALISYTLHQFKKDKDYSWPLLFPMVKSAVRAMDVIQDFSAQKLNHQVKGFVVSGLSKRGWTTWLTGANDTRVKAIAPMVIDILNMPVSLDYQIKTWGDYSVEIQDYVKLGIPQSTGSSDGQAISTMIDPYSYRAKLTMPKLIFMGTNDPYWVIDNVKNYLKDIPGENRLHYVPNAGHDLAGGDQAMEALGAFFGTTISGTGFPECKWKETVSKKGIQLAIKTNSAGLEDVIVWSATSEDQDLRNDKWTSKSLGLKGKSNVKVNIEYPKSGFKAFYVDLKYRKSNGETYTQSTRVFLANEQSVL